MFSSAVYNSGGQDATSNYLSRNYTIMTKTTKISGFTRIALLGSTLGVASLLAMSAPALALAADYGYVNMAGEVNMVQASSPMEAINIAPNIGVHSGVILLDSQSDIELLDDSVAGA